ncbi:MAG: hypothetical protein L0Y44_02085 [Phycisphaerales bacterium]|nr:hypothetical protein [Phycisphaerales bacterium]
MHSRIPLGLTSLVVLLISEPVRAGGCQDWHKGPMETIEVGTPGEVFCSTIWDPDDAGPLPEMLYVGGFFSSIGGVTANNIAAWDGASWRPLIAGGQNGIEGAVSALAVYDGELIVGGQFTSAGGDNNADDCNNIARWDGHSWNPLDVGVSGGFVVGVQSLATYDGDLIVGGSFIEASGVAANSVARWDGESWQPMGTGLTNGASPAYARDLQEFGGELFVGGEFIEAGGVAATHVARWNGASWLAAGFLGNLFGVAALEIHNGQLYAGGPFEWIPANIHQVARWNGSGWVSVGGGINLSYDAVGDLKSYAGELYAGGVFQLSDGPKNVLARWNGASWSYVGAFGWGYGAYHLNLYDSQMLLGGDFDMLDGATVNSLGLWNAASFIGFDTPPPKVCSIANFGSNLAVGGDFLQSTNDAAPASHIAKWDGAKLNPLGTGMSGPVNALVLFTQPAPSLATELVAGGQFLVTSGVVVNNVARWIEPPGGPPPTAWEPMGSGFDGAVHALVRHNGATYAAGAFTFSGGVPANRIAVWNEATDTWQPLADGGLNGPVYALASYGGLLYAGGTFTNAGGSSAVYVAKWNGSNWTKLGGAQQGDQLNANGPGSGVYALAVHGGTLRIGGKFAYSNELVNVTNLIGWNGAFWSASASANDTVRSLLYTGQALYAAGDFTVVGGQSADHIAHWDGRCGTNFWAAPMAASMRWLSSMAKCTPAAHSWKSRTASSSHPVGPSITRTEPCGSRITRSPPSGHAGRTSRRIASRPQGMAACSTSGERTVCR